jgi:non-specific serine/threonine protein kinase/serine/threonine-protein kinase
MGMVYLAERADEQFQKQVAIKLVRPGLDTQEITVRFRHERQTLAALEHPNIVRLLDGGTTDDGTPYLVMDYVEGVPLLEFCDSRRLPIRKRLELFRTVCSAVHCAHQSLVVHRDIKPGNVLVTPDGTPKLLDFGIAKVIKPELGGQAELTGASMHPMTLKYASPEQIKHRPITIATDVYSLGVVLYELIAAHYPYVTKDQAPLSLAWTICEQEPMRPSVAVTRLDAERSPAQIAAARDETPEKLHAQLKEDLDAIVTMAMRKEPERRYASVEQFAEDIRRYLAGLPVVARQSTLAYRAEKFVRRHKASVAVGAVATLLLIAGLIGVIWQGRVAERERAKAERRFKDVRELANAFLFDFHEAIRDLPGATPARVLLVRKASEYLEKLSRDAAGDESLELELAEAYGKLGSVQGNPYGSNLGDTQGALASYHKALAVSESALRTNPKSREAQRAVALAQGQLAEVLPIAGRVEEAASHLRRAAQTLDNLAQAQPRNIQARIDVARAYDGLGDVTGGLVVTGMGDSKTALEHYRQSLKHWEAAASMEPKNSVTRRGVAILNMKIADLEMQAGRPAEALPVYRKSRDLMEKLSLAHPDNATVRRLIAALDRKIGGAQADLGDLKGAVESFGSAASIFEAMVTADPQNAQAKLGLAATLKDAGDLQNRNGNVAGALQAYGQVIAVIEKLAAEDPDNLERRGQLADVLVLIGDLLARRGQPVEGRRQVQRGLELMKKLADRAEATPAEQQRLASALLTTEPVDLRNPQLALRYAEQAVAGTRSANALFLDTLALAYYETGDAVRAVRTAEQAQALAPTGSSRRAMIDNHLARFRVGR